MRSMFRLPSALAIALFCVTPAAAAPKAKAPVPADGAKKSGKEISTDDRALDKQMDWETKVLGPNNIKKIDLAKIQKLQAEELVRREKQEKVDQADKDRKEREAAAAAATQRNVKAPSTREVPSVEEAAPPAKPVEKHDDAFVDKLLTGKGDKKKVAVSNDEVDELLNKAKHEKAPAASGRARGKGGDNVDQLLATADKQAPVKTTTRKAVEAPETVSAEAAAREAALRSVAAAAAAKANEDRARRRTAIPDAAVLRAQASAKTSSEPARPTASRAAWVDPFAADGGGQSSSSAKGRGKSGHSAVTSAASSSSRAPAAAGRHGPATRPAGPAVRPAANDSWQDPFDAGGGVKPRPAPAKTAPAARPGKHPPNWKDPFA